MLDKVGTGVYGGDMNPTTTPKETTMRTVYFDSRSTIADVLAAGYKDGDRVTFHYENGGSTTGVLCGGRTRGYPSKPLADIGEVWGHGTELVAMVPGKGRRRFLIRKCDRMTAAD